MARPKSEEKRNTLLTVATQVFAKNGLTASTASITSAAGMAEGTLFVYFKGKDELINTLYREIKHELAEAMLAGFPRSGSVRDKMQYVWNQYVQWGANNPERLNVLHKLKVWDGVSQEVRAETAACYEELHELIDGAIRDGVFLEVPYEFIMAMMTAQSETVMNFMRIKPQESEDYKEKGFEIFWNGITKSK